MDIFCVGDVVVIDGIPYAPPDAREYADRIHAASHDAEEYSRMHRRPSLRAIAEQLATICGHGPRED